MTIENRTRKAAEIDRSEIQILLLKFALCKLTRKDLMKHLSVSDHTAKTIAALLVNEGLLFSIGTPKRPAWNLTHIGAVNFVKRKPRKAADQKKFNYWSDLALAGKAKTKCASVVVCAEPERLAA